MIADNAVTFCFVLCVAHITSLVELPLVEENSIRMIESIMRDTIITLFSLLRIKNTVYKKIKEYPLVHNRLVSNYNALKEIEKLTKDNNSNINNETKVFILAINKLLDEDINIRAYTSVLTNVSVNDYIFIFLTKFESLTKEYDIRRKLPISNDIYRIITDDSNANYYINSTEETRNKLNEDDSVLVYSDYWRQEQSFRRIYRGERTNIKYFPFMASVHIFNRFFCAGAIIKSDLVVTAASCIQLAYNNRFFRENPAFLSVRVGTKYTIGGESIPVLEVYFYPNYDPKNLHNNICVLRLLRKINFKRKRVKKIAIDRVPSTLSLYTEGVTILGWGARKMNNVIVNPLQNILSFAVLDVYPIKECQEVYSKEYVTRRNFCAGFFSKGGGACNHDVGGPGVVNGILMGVVSFGAPACGSPDAPTVFTKIGYYADWIDDIMNQDVPVRSKKTSLLPTTTSSIHEYETPTTSIRMVPLDEKPSSNLVNESDSLRILENSALFQHLLSSIFVNKGSNEYQDIFQTKELQDTNQNSMKTKIEISSTTQTPLNIVPYTKAYYDTLTPMGDVDPADEITDEMNSGDETNIKSLNIDHDLETDLVNVIDNKDLIKIIENISSLEEEKLLENTKLLDLIKDRHIDGRINEANDSVLTLLYFSESEKNQDNLKNIGTFDDAREDFDSEGLSIATDQFVDFTYKSKNMSIEYDILSKNNIFDLISAAVEEKLNKNN